MAKKLGKSEKLDLILSELSALRADIKSLGKEGSRGAKPGATARARPVPAKKAAKRAQPARKPAKAPAKPVLVETDDEDAPSRPASRIA